MEDRQGEIIYNDHQRCSDLYLVISGTVKIHRISDRGHQVLVDLYRPDEFFGEAALVSLSHTSEQAVAHQRATLMTWRACDIEEIIKEPPPVALAPLSAFCPPALHFELRHPVLS